MAHSRVRLKLGALYLVVAGVFFLAAYELSFPLLLVRLNLWPCLVFLAVLLAAFGLGNIVVEYMARSGIARFSPGELVDRNVIRASLFPIAEEIFLSVAIGLGIVAYVVLAFNLLHLLRRAFVLPVLFLLVVFGVIRGYRLRKRAVIPALAKPERKGRRQGWKLPPVFRFGVLICIFVPLVVSFFLALTPVHQSDAIRYHMAVPALYVDAGGYVDLPHSAFSNFPFTIEMLYTLGLLFGAESAAKLVHWLFFVLLVAGIYCLGRHIRMRALGILAAVVLANVPFIPIFSSWAFIEMGLAFYQFMVFYCLIRLLRCLAGREVWGEEQRPPDPSKQRRFALQPSGWVVLCGIFSGFALGTKYTSLFPFAVAVATLVIVTQRDRLRERRSKKVRGTSERVDRWKPLPNPLRNLTVLILLTVLIASPWYVKNWIHLGNPVYPFAGSIFPTPHWSEYNTVFYRYHAGMKGELNQFWKRDPIAKLWDLVTLPYSLTMAKKLDNDVAYFASCEFSRLWPWNREDGIIGGIFPFLRSGDSAILKNVDFGRWEVGPLWLLLLPLILTVKRRPWEIRLLLLYGGLLFLFWAFTYRDNRFLVPAFAVLAVPAGYVLLGYSQRTRRVFAAFRAFFLIILLWNMLWMLRSVFTSYNPFPIITGRVSVLGFLEKQEELRDTDAFIKEREELRRTGGFIRAVYEANQVRSRGEKILLAGAYQGYHCDPPYVCADWFNTPVLIEWIRATGSVDEIKQRLRDERVDYVLIHQGEIDKYWVYYVLHFLPVDEACAWLERFRDVGDMARAILRQNLMEKGSASPVWEIYDQLLLNEEFLGPAYEEKLAELARTILLQNLMEKVSASPAWRIYNQLLLNEEFLEPVYEEQFTEEEKRERPPLPARSKIGVYRVTP